MENNLVTIKGLVTKCEFSHETHEEKFYKLNVNVYRQSGILDEIPVLVSENVFIDIAFLQNQNVEINGEFRSHNQEVDGKRKLILSVLAKTISFSVENEFSNDITLNAFICKPPILRTTPLGKTVCDLLVAVNRKTRKSDYIPCIIWGKNAKIAGKLNVGDNIIINGRIQSRKYTKNNETRTAYEVSINDLHKVQEEIEL